MTNRDRHATQATAFPTEFKAQIIALARAERSVPELAREFEPTIYAWLKQADRDIGRRADGLGPPSTKSFAASARRTANSS